MGINSRMMCVVSRSSSAYFTRLNPKYGWDKSTCTNSTLLRSCPSSRLQAEVSKPRSMHKVFCFDRPPSSARLKQYILRTCCWWVREFNRYEPREPVLPVKTIVTSGDVSAPLALSVIVMAGILGAAFGRYYRLESLGGTSSTACR